MSGARTRGVCVCTRSFSSDLSLPRGSSTLICSAITQISQPRQITDQRLCTDVPKTHTHAQTHLCVMMALDGDICQSCVIAGACWQDNRLDIAFLESGEREMGKREEEEKREGGREDRTRAEGY